MSNDTSDRLTAANTSALTKLHKKFSKLGLDDLLAELEALDADALEARIASSEANLAEIEQRKADDQDLANLAEQVSEIRKGYSAEIKTQRLIQRTCHLLREAKGAA
jgi:phage I-like protein